MSASVSGERLHLLLTLGSDRYAIDIADVIEVLPLVRLKELPGAPFGVAGVMNFRDDAVPVVDLELLATGTAAPSRMRTRIILVRYAPDDRTLGLLVREAAETLRADPASFVDAGVTTDGTPYLGPVLTTPDGVIQLVAVSALLSDALRSALFAPGHAA